MANIPDEKLDKVLNHLDRINSACDLFRTDLNSFKGRLDAIEQEREKEKADAKARADAEEKARKDAEEKEKADAAARAAADPELTRRLAEIDVAAGALSVQSKSAFAEAQMRADSAYQAWGRSAPHALHGETLRDFQIRLLKPLQQHSKVYKDSALDLIGDNAAFSTIEGVIINDSIEASCAAPPAGAPLREVTERSSSGHTITKFFGDSAVTWSPFMGGATRFGRINRPKQ